MDVLPRYKPAFSSEPEYEEARSVRRHFEEFCKSYDIRLVERMYVGYWLPHPVQRELWGLFPVTFSELHLAMLYGMEIFLHTPYLDVAREAVAIGANHLSVKDPRFQEAYDRLGEWLECR